LVELLSRLQEIRTGGARFEVVEHRHDYGNAYLIAHRSADSVYRASQHTHNYNTCTPLAKSRHIHMLEVHTFTCVTRASLLHTRPEIPSVVFL
jgi:hypothetical protein